LTTIATDSTSVELEDGDEDGVVRSSETFMANTFSLIPPSSPAFANGSVAAPAAALAVRNARRQLVERFILFFLLKFPNKRRYKWEKKNACIFHCFIVDKKFFIKN
jgi:hypothetical protein